MVGIYEPYTITFLEMEIWAGHIACNCLLLVMIAEIEVTN